MLSSDQSLEVEDLSVEQGESDERANTTLRAVWTTVRVASKVAAMALIIAGAWLFWVWAAPKIWPAGAPALVKPGIGLFAGICIAARCVWNVLFLCPETE